MSDHSATAGDIRTQIRAAIAHLEHVLPGQAPIRDFVHHNTLHGYQHLGFREAIAEARRITGTRGFLPLERFRAYFAEGRIALADLEAVLAESPELGADEPLIAGAPDLDPPLRRRDLYLAALLHPIGPVTAARRNWQIDELDALRRFQPEVPAAARQRLLVRHRAQGHSGDGEAEAIADLHAACLDALGLNASGPHPEELLDLSPEQAERVLGGGQHLDAPLSVERQMRIEAAAQLQALLGRVGPDLTLRGLLRLLTGEDLMDQVRPQVVRHLTTGLDEGLAAWRNPRQGLGLYQSWRLAARADLTPVFRGLDTWEAEVEAMPQDPLEAIIAELKHLGLDREHWVAYLERLALELPGWSGMTLWRDLHAGLCGYTTPVSMLDYLAMRLALERIYAQRLCRSHWQIEANLDMLRWYFRRHPAELMVRQALYGDVLPEYLAARAARAAAHSDLDRGDPGWARLAALLWTWRRTADGPAASAPAAVSPPPALAPGSPGLATDAGRRPSVPRSAWSLFQAAQHLGLCGAEMRALGPEGAAAILAALDRLDADTAGYLWLQAFERHYREQVLAALAHNRGRGRWSRRGDPDAMPAAQVMFCMDDREEGIRRHLEELDPGIETLGAAAHFSVPHNWRGLDDTSVTALAPVIPVPVIPSQEVREVARAECEAVGNVHARRHRWLRSVTGLLLQRGRLGLLGPAVVAALAGPFTGLALAGKLAAPAGFARLVRALRSAVEPHVDTRIAFAAPNDSPPASPAAPRLGYTDQEQAERVEALLVSTGLTKGFSPLVVILGHGSRNQNNPHASAYNCGACSGRFSGPNARLVCAMANRGAVRALLAGRGIEIPNGTWFVGGERDTCNDQVEWYDTQDVPADAGRTLERVREALGQAGQLHAQERCRRFASAPPGMDPQAAHRHVAARAMDISQVRPELGHATNACAFFGRRSLSRGAFFDRRAFLISYDPTHDADGKVLEQHLVANGAVGAGISLEYYFSASNDEGYGCGTKVTHNVAGLLGVMEGTTSDLRTGLPRQMVEIHEAMRLLVVVEQTTEILTAICQRQPAVAELVGGAWIQLASLNPQTGAIALFRPTGMWKSREEAGADPGRPGIGWVLWKPPAEPPPRARRSPECYLGFNGPRPPALIDAPDHA